MTTDQTEPAAPTPADAPTQVARPSISCPGCGAHLDGDQAWCTECGLAARTRIADTPNWRLPLILAGALALGAVVALVIAFVVLTGDNAPLPETTPTAAAPADTVPTTTVPISTVPTTTVPPSTVPTTPVTTVPSTTPTTATPTTPVTTTPTPTTPTPTTPGATTPTTTPTTPSTGGASPAPSP